MKNILEVPGMRYLAAMLLLAGLNSGHIATAQAQTTTDFPSRPVHIVMPYPPGGSDTLARIFTNKLTETMGQPFIIENRPGKNVAATYVAKSAPDGYTVLAVVPDFTIAPAIDKDLQLDMIKDFTPLSLLSRAPYYLVVNASLPAKSVRELAALMKARPNQLHFGGAQNGGILHLTNVWFWSHDNLKATFVPYKGIAQAVTDVLGGQIDGVFAIAVAVIPQVKAGKLRAIGVSTAQRSKDYPDIPSIAEQGVPGFDVSSFHGWSGPAGMRPAVVAKFSEELARITRLPDVAQRLAAENAEAVGSTAEQFSRFIATEIPRWRKLVQDAGIVIKD